MTLHMNRFFGFYSKHGLGIVYYHIYVGFLSNFIKYEEHRNEAINRVEASFKTYE